MRDALPSPVGTAEYRRSAILMGVSQYGDDDLPALHCAEADAHAMSVVLADQERGGYLTTTIKPNATRDEVLGRVEEVLSALTSNDMFLFYFSGHSIRDSAGRLYLALSGTDVKKPHTALRLDELMALIDEASPTEVVLILDCCFSGSVESSFKELSSQKNMWVITASTDIQSAFEKEGSENSILTGFLLDGLKWGFADTDNTGEISVFEAYSYAERLVHGAFSGSGSLTQEPMLFVPSGSRGSVVLASNPLSHHVNLENLPIELLPAYVAAVGVANVTKTPTPYSFVFQLLNKPEYMVEGERYRAFALTISHTHTPNIVVTENSFECDAFFPSDSLGPKALEAKQVVDGVVRVRLRLPLANISAILGAKTDEVSDDGSVPSLEVLARNMD